MGSLRWRMTLVLTALALPVAAAAQDRKPNPEVDVLVETNLRIAPEHTEKYKSLLGTYARQCLGGLAAKPRKDAPAQPEDGAAYYRLAVAHAGSIVVANSPKIDRAADRSDGSVRYLLARQKGRFQFDLTRWTGKAYESVDKWTSDFSTVHYTPVSPDMTRSDIPKWRKEALMRAYPNAVKDGILEHILPIKVVRTFGQPGGTQSLVVALANESLWPLKTVKIVILWPKQHGKEAYRYRAELNYSGLLMPTEKTTLRGKGTVMAGAYRYELAMPMQITATPTFDPNRGPLWLRRQVEAMKHSATRSAAVRIMERSLGWLTPVETKTAVSALIQLLARDAPQGEADVPRGARVLLEKIGRPAVPLLADALTHDNPGIRLGAACVLQKIRVTDQTVLSRLRDALKDDCQPVRAAAAKALEASGRTVTPE